jgi:hypothetical protein
MLKWSEPDLTEYFGAVAKRDDNDAFAYSFEVSRDGLRLLAFSLLLLVLMTGCDPGYGIYRHAKVPFMPTPSMIRMAIRQTPGVDNVQYDFEEGGRPLTWTGIKPPDQVYTFCYRGGTNVHGCLAFVVNYEGTVEYSQNLMMLGRPPPQAWIDATHPVMLQIESRLEHDCGLPNLSSAVKENLIGVRIK